MLQTIGLLFVCLHVTTTILKLLLVRLHVLCLCLFGIVLLQEGSQCIDSVLVNTQMVVVDPVVLLVEDNDMYPCCGEISVSNYSILANELLILFTMLT